MSALAEALVAAQRRSLATLEKAYVAGAIEAEPMIEAMEGDRTAVGQPKAGSVILWPLYAWALFVLLCAVRLWTR